MDLRTQKTIMPQLVFRLTVNVVNCVGLKVSEKIIDKTSRLSTILTSHQGLCGTFWFISLITLSFPLTKRTFSLFIILSDLVHRLKNANRQSRLSRWWNHYFSFFIWSSPTNDNTGWNSEERKMESAMKRSIKGDIFA